MTIVGTTRPALSALLLCALNAAPCSTAEPGKTSCKRVSEPAIAIETKSATFDFPGGAKIGYVVPGMKYMYSSMTHHTDGETWVLLIGRGGTYSGWIPQKAGRFVGPVFHCDTATEPLYGKAR